MVTDHVLKQLFGDKLVLSSWLLPGSDWPSGVYRNGTTGDQHRRTTERFWSRLSVPKVKVVIMQNDLMYSFVMEPIHCNHFIYEQWKESTRQNEDQSMKKVCVFSLWWTRTRDRSLESRRVQFDESLPQFINSHSWSSWKKEKQQTTDQLHVIKDENSLLNYSNEHGLLIMD